MQRAELERQLDKLNDRWERIGDKISEREAWNRPTDDLEKRLAQIEKEMADLETALAQLPAEPPRAYVERNIQSAIDKTELFIKCLADGRACRCPQLFNGITADLQSARSEMNDQQRRLTGNGWKFLNEAVRAVRWSNYREAEKQARSALAGFKTAADIGLTSGPYGCPRPICCAL